MKGANSIDPGHDRVRPVLRIVGPVLLVVGFGCFLGSMPLVMFTGYFAFGFLGFVGVVLLFIGSTMTGFGFMGAVARYQAQEVAPVVSDTFNYVAGETQEGVRTIVGAVRDGLGAGPSCVCASCGASNDVDARFCDACGAAMSSDAACPSCGKANDVDARFCDDCGGAIR